jgi:hypothetical protein
MFSKDQDQSNKRKCLRADFRGTISVEFPDCPEGNGCLSRDISEKGLRVNFEHFVKPNTPIRIKFRLMQGMEPMVFEGRVAWASQMPSSDRYQLGIEFTGHNEEGQKNIHSYVISNHSK